MPTSLAASVAALPFLLAPGARRLVNALIEGDLVAWTGVSIGIVVVVAIIIKQNRSRRLNQPDERDDRRDADR